VQFRIEVNRQGTGWVVEVTSCSTNQLVVDSKGQPFSRVLRSVGAENNLFPQPPEIEANAIPDTADNPHRLLCSTEAEPINTIYQKYVQRQADNVVTFGRYLFATLLGDELWAAMNGQAGNDRIELALTWKDDYLINRLPWEMMHNGTRFLAEEPEVAITRRVAGTSQTLSEMSAPRVLFVVGSDLKNSVIRPGAEYLGLLRSLKPGTNLRLKTHLLLQATPRRLKAAIKWFRPTVVHFICHGVPVGGQETALSLMPDEGVNVELVKAEALLKLLQPDPKLPLPQVVILNACYTATLLELPAYSKSGQVMLPIAAKLVAGGDGVPGVPIVVGMGGEVSDQACRLFTRCFYQALLEGEEVAHAAADGRRVGIIEDGLTDPKTTIDWALPTLFMSAGVNEARILIKPSDKEKLWHEVAAEFAPPAYPTFCDRLGFFEWYDCLMAQNLDDLPTPQPHIGDLQTLAVSLGEKDKKYSTAQLGRTWLLRQFAANAALEGHLPCLMSLEWIERDKDEYPTDLNGLVDDFRRSINRTAQLFKLPFNTDTIDLVRDLAAGSAEPAELPLDLKAAKGEERGWGGPLVHFVALRIDLLRLLELRHAELPEPERASTKLLLLIDDVHQMDKATRLLLQFFTSVYGLRSNSSLTPDSPTAKSGIRVVCTYDLSRGLGEENTITTWLEAAKGTREVPLRVFEAPEDRFAYELFLSRWKDQNGVEVPLSVETKTQPQAEKFFENLAKRVEGIPSLLKSTRTNDFIDVYLEAAPNLLRKTNDEDRVKLISKLKRGA
jgi:hypothetical protein